MTTVRFDISEAREAAKYIGVSIDKVAKRAILATAIRVVHHIVTTVVPAEKRQPVDRGAYRAGWRFKKTSDGAEVRNAMPYAAVIEYGAKAERVKISRAMIDALTAWVQRKGIGGFVTKYAKQPRKATKDEARKIAWAIAMKMKMTGIFNEGKGLRILEKALKHVDRIFAQELKEELAREFG
jgi:hypothetical protein